MQRPRLPPSAAEKKGNAVPSVPESFAACMKGEKERSGPLVHRVFSCGKGRGGSRDR